MKFPIKQTMAISRYISAKKKAGEKRFPLVLMLEPLHACNLQCGGCGRIREYKETLSKLVPLDSCMKAIKDCGAPVVSICGGEPLIYKEIKELVEGSLELGRVTYLCTNGTVMDWKLPALKPHPFLNINVHLDGLERTHDAITNRPGTFRQVCENIKVAKKGGFTVCTNTTVYKETDPLEVEDLFRHLQGIGVDGMLVSPSFDYSDVEDQSCFLTRAEIAEKFKVIRKFAPKYKVWSTPLFLDFCAGLREYKCSPWGNVTYNIAGWKAPCYLVTDDHYENYSDFMKGVDWEKFESGKDKRCANCMVHCGFEASVALNGRSLLDNLRMGWWMVS